MEDEDEGRHDRAVLRQVEDERRGRHPNLPQEAGLRGGDLRVGVSMEANENLRTGTAPDAYERLALCGIEGWYNEREGAPNKTPDVAGLLVAKLHGLLPNAGRKTIEHAFLSVCA